MSSPANFPDLDTPLVRGPVTQPPVLTDLGYLKELIGTWKSPPGDEATGYNVMPLPQQGGYILKNFPYFEEMTFAPIAGTAPNRGGTFTQTAYTLFYEQRVFFATNPAPPGAPSVKDSLIHAENGAWLHFVNGPQLSGAYGPNFVENPHIPVQPPAYEYAKQVSVPHGNSILATGYSQHVDYEPGQYPAFPQANHEELPFLGQPNIIDPNSKLLEQLQKNRLRILSADIIHVSTKAPGGNVDNIAFEGTQSRVTGFDSTWYIEKVVSEDSSEVRTQLQYSQTVHMTLLIDNAPRNFLHIDANTLVPA